MATNAGIQGGTTENDSVATLHPVLQTNDLLESILRRVSQTKRDKWMYSYALVCHKWMELSAQAQASFRPRKSLSEEQLLSQMFQFPNLTLIDLSNGSVEELTDSFCSRVNEESSSSSGSSVPAWGLSHLTHLSTCYVKSDDVSEAGWGSLFQATPRIRSLGMDPHCSIDAVLPALSGLRKLELGAANLPNLPDFARLPHLEELDIEMDTESTVCELPAGVGTLSRLRVLKLRNFNGQSVLDALSTLSSLRDLYLFECDMVEFPPNFSPSSKLQKFELDWCCSLSSSPDLSSFPELLSFRLHNCDEISSIHASLVSLSRLTALTISTCERLASLPEGDWGGLTDLKVLKLEDLPDLQQLPSGFSSLHALEVLRIWCCPKLQDLPEGFWGSLEKLRMVDLEGMKAIRR